MNKFLIISLVVILSNCSLQNTVTTPQSNNPSQTPEVQKTPIPISVVSSKPIEALPQIFAYPKQIALRVGDLRKVVPFVKIKDKFSIDNITYSSSNTSVAEISQDGIIKSISEGEVNIDVMNKIENLKTTVSSKGFCN